MNLIIKMCHVRDYWPFQKSIMHQENCRKERSESKLHLNFIYFKFLRKKGSSFRNESALTADMTLYTWEMTP